MEVKSDNVRKTLLTALSIISGGADIASFPMAFWEEWGFTPQQYGDYRLAQDTGIFEEKWRRKAEEYLAGFLYGLSEKKMVDTAAKSEDEIERSMVDVIHTGIGPYMHLERYTVDLSHRGIEINAFAKKNFYGDYPLEVMAANAHDRVAYAVEKEFGTYLVSEGEAEGVRRLGGDRVSLFWIFRHRS